MQESFSKTYMGNPGFDFKSPHDFVEAKKSWFFFDEEYVCLGAAINSNRRLPVESSAKRIYFSADGTLYALSGRDQLCRVYRTSDGVMVADLN